jgi:hypothetical protein
VNITIKITHPSGTVMEVNIPMLDSTVVAMPSTPVTPDEPQVASETGNPVADGLVDRFHADGVEASIPYISGDKAVEFLEKQFGFNKEDLQPTGKRYASVQDMLEGKEIVREVPADVADTSEQFKCTDGFYVIPPALYSDFCSAFGSTATDRELTKARLWCETNSQNRKTRRGMGRFLNAWLCRAQGEKRTPVKGRSGSLLESANTSQQGW